MDILKSITGLPVPGIGLFIQRGNIALGYYLPAFVY
jgi:hypothetical protein